MLTSKRALVALAVLAAGLAAATPASAEPRKPLVNNPLITIIGLEETQNNALEHALLQTLVNGDSVGWANPQQITPLLGTATAETGSPTTALLQAQINKDLANLGLASPSPATQGR
ncbi:hypothetical protein [Kitasatospora sp. GAS1066B]|uniref:hypothetical protein n=1 Tax=Kitasatospora sp. GAS1066B TaxID=3156271 RepID=UPI003518BDC1